MTGTTFFLPKDLQVPPFALTVLLLCPRPPASPSPSPLPSPLLVVVPAPSSSDPAGGAPRLRVPPAVLGLSVVRRADRLATVLMTRFDMFALYKYYFISYHVL